MACGRHSPEEGENNYLNLRTQLQNVHLSLQQIDMYMSIQIDEKMDRKRRIYQQTDREMSRDG